MSCWYLVMVTHMCAQAHLFFFPHAQFLFLMKCTNALLMVAAKYDIVRVTIKVARIHVYCATLQGHLLVLKGKTSQYKYSSLSEKGMELWW